MDATNDYHSIPSVTLVDAMMNENNDVIIQDENVNNSVGKSCASSNDPTVRSDTGVIPASPSQTRHVLSSRTTTPRSATQRRKVQTTKPPSSLMDQLELLMGQDTTNDVAASPSKTPRKKKKPSLNDTERDDSTRATSSEHNDDLFNSERSTKTRRSKTSSTSRSNGDVPTTPRSPQRKKKLLSSDVLHSITTDNDVADICETKKQHKMPSSPRRVKPSNKNVEHTTSMDAVSERLNKSLSSMATRVQSKKLESDGASKPMESTSERASRSSTRMGRKQVVSSGEKNIAIIETTEPSSIQKRSSFRMEPLMISPNTHKTKVPFEADVGPVLVQADGTSVASENDDMATTPLLLLSCERSESINQSMLKPNVLSDDTLDRLNRSSLSDIEKSGIGVERSIKKAIQKAKKKKNEALTSSLSCICSNALPLIHVGESLISQSNEDAIDTEFNRSIAIDNGALIDSLQEFMKETGESNVAVQKQLNNSLNLDDDYIEEEVIDDEYDNDNGEVAVAFNSSANLSTIAAEMDEAMTKIWAKFDEKVTKSTTDTCTTEDPKSHLIPPVDQSAEVVEELLNVNDKSTNDSIEVGLSTTSTPIKTNGNDVPEEIENGNISESKVLCPTSEEILKCSEVETSPTLLNMQKPDDTRLSSLVKMLVIDAWSGDLAKVISCLDEMSIICETDTTAVTEIFDHGGHLVMIVLMRQYTNNARVQIAALTTLQKAAECGNVFTDAIIALGALELIIVTMMNHDNNVDVTTAGCGALLNLTVPAKHAKVFVFELHGIQAIAHVCAKFPTKIELQKYAVWILQYFSYWENYTMQIVQQGGMQTLAKMIESFSSMMNHHVEISNESSISSITGINNINNKAAIESIVKSASATMKRLL